MKNPDDFKKQSKEQYPLNKNFLQHIKRRPPANLDDRFHSLHEETFEKMDCLTCANCCKTTSPIIKESDIDRLSRHLKIKPSAVIEKYLQKDAQDYILKSTPCPFLDPDNYCSVYESRPAACREYPHTNRKRMYQILDLTLKNTEVCPAVLSIVEKLRINSGR